MPSSVPSAAKVAKGLNTVMYVNNKGLPLIAKVKAVSGTTLDLQLVGYSHATRSLSAVPKRTAMGQTGVWYNTK